MGKYKKCPRCELNWIPVEEELCEVCKAELGKASSISLIEDEEEDEDAYEDRICPICKVNYLNDDEEICASCRAERLNKKSSTRVEEEIERDVEDDEDSWKEYVDNDNMEEDVSLQLLQDDELNESFDDEEAPQEADSFDDDLPDDFDEDFSDVELDDEDSEDEEDDEEDL